ncbi:MAG: DUF4197 domain-containing protein [Vitreoscilla sp.]|nr:DUF4197 domain-containing protein [Polaromonas sp.]
MQRRLLNQAGVSAIGALVLATYGQAQALSLGDLAGISNKDASAGLKTALEKGALAAVALLGKTDGFFGNDKVRIPLPGYLNDVAGLLKNLGQGKRVDELTLSLNRAAEAAVPMGKTLLVNAVRNMSVLDAKNILAGGDTSVTAFFADKTRAPLSITFLPVVTKATEKVGLLNKYNEFAGKAAGFGLVKKEDANIQQYVTGKALDGLYLVIGEEEKKIRQDPVGTGSAILKKVFGAMK